MSNNHSDYMECKDNKHCKPCCEPCKIIKITGPTGSIGPTGPIGPVNPEREVIGLNVFLYDVSYTGSTGPTGQITINEPENFLPFNMINIEGNGIIYDPNYSYESNNIPVFNVVGSTGSGSGSFFNVSYDVSFDIEHTNKNSTLMYEIKTALALLDQDPKENTLNIVESKFITIPPNLNPTTPICISNSAAGTMWMNYGETYTFFVSLIQYIDGIVNTINVKSPCADPKLNNRLTISRISP